MLKAYQIDDLRVGMVVGRDVLDTDTSILIGAGS